jgi:hypothetical protein
MNDSKWKDMSRYDTHGHPHFFNPHLNMRVIEDVDVVAVELEYFPNLNDKYFEIIRVTGSARREPGDKFDSEVGRNLAMGRAFVRLGEKLVKRGMGKSSHNDWVRDTRQKLAEKSGNVMKRVQDNKTDIGDKKGKSFFKKG